MQATVSTIDTIGFNFSSGFRDYAKHKVTRASSMDIRETIFDLNVYLELFSSIE